MNSAWRRSAQNALDVVAAFYPDRVIAPRTRFGLEEIFDKLAKGDDPPGAEAPSL